MQAEHLGSDIWVYRNLLDAEVCEEICAKLDQDSRKTYWKDSQYHDNREGQLLRISQYAEWEEVDRLFFQATGKMINHYTREYEIEHLPLKDEGYILGVYNPGEGCLKHQDAGDKIGRVISIVLYLNDTPSGETVFPRQKISVRPERGMAVVWPPYYTHPHFVAPVLEKRYFMVTFAKFQLALVKWGGTETGFVQTDVDLD